MGGDLKKKHKVVDPQLIWGENLQKIGVEAVGKAGGRFAKQTLTQVSVAMHMQKFTIR